MKNISMNNFGLPHAHRFPQLDLYTDGDDAFKLVLINLMLENLDELKFALQASHAQQDVGIFAKAVHKAKTTLSILDDTDLCQSAEEMKQQVNKPESWMPFFRLCDRMKERLREEKTDQQYVLEKKASGY